MIKRSSSSPKKESPSASPRRRKASPGRPKESPVSRPASAENSASAKESEPTDALHPHPVRIGYFQPEAHAVFVAGSFNEWDPRATPLARDSVGAWSVELALSRGEHRYRLVVDGQWCDDPNAQRLVSNPFGGYDAAIFVQ
jgi:1,4-alpha-glucan branching enzyme